MAHLFKEVLDICLSLHKERNWGRFSPQHLVDMEGVACPEEIDQVCNAFSFWSGLGYFKVEVDIVSEDGETLCGGCPADWSESDVEVAKNALLDPHCFVSTGYLITDKFREECGALTD